MVSIRSSVVLSVCVGFLVFCFLVAKTLDFTSTPLLGDQSSHTMQALSLAYDFDLKFDANDERHWNGLGWSDSPVGLFYQEYSDGYAFAKPYGYSLYLSPFVYLLGEVGFIFGNCVLLGLLFILVYRVLSKQYSKPLALGLTVAFTFFSYAYFYTFTIHSDLFLAVLTISFVYATTHTLEKERGEDSWVISVLLAFLVMEKISFIVLLAPITMYLFWKVPIKRKILAVGVFLISIAFFSFPYFYYSDGQSWNPYSGERLMLSSATGFPIFFEVHDVSSSTSATGKGIFSFNYIYENIFNFEQLKTKFLSLYYYFFGAYTGMLAFAPLCLIVIIASIWRTVSGFDIRLFWSLFGLLAFIGFYVVLFTDNYYGGFQSVGNRYFLQVSPIVILLLYFLRLSNFTSLALIAFAFFASMLFNLPHHKQPHFAYSRITDTSEMQSYLPFDRTQQPLSYYFPWGQRVNLSLVPQRANAYRSFKDSVIYDANSNSVQPYSEYFADSDTQLFREIIVNDIQVLADRGFHYSGGTYVWSKNRSSLLVKNDGKPINLVLRTYPNTNRVMITALGKSTLVELIKGEHRSFSLKLDNYPQEWVRLNFEADESARPSDKSFMSPDSREYSFSVSIYQ